MALHGDLEPVIEADGVRFVFEVTNDGENIEEITFRDSGKADFAVARADEDGGEREGEGEEESEEHWRWSEGRMFAQVIETEQLDPGQSSVYEGEWRSPNTGSYVARATLRARDHDLEAACEFTIEK